MGKIKAIKNHDGLCWKCLKTVYKEQIHNILIPEMGYGSQFDGESTEIHLCDGCYNESTKNVPLIWGMEEIPCNGVWGEHGCTEFKYENEMLEYIDNLPLQGKQFVRNEFTIGGNSYKMNAQDWIDYELDILPHEKCKEYGLYSPQEIKAYNEKFKSCQYPINVIYDDGSKSCRCPFYASGEYGQIPSEYNASTECYTCENYRKRTTAIGDINASKFENYSIDAMFMIVHNKVDKASELVEKIYK